MKNDKYKELRRALAEGKTIQLNGTAINGGYGETWNDCSEENLFIYDISAYRVKPEKTQINYHGFKEGDLVTNKDFCEYEPFKLSTKHFKGVTARNQAWFNSLELWKPKIGEWVIPDSGINDDMFVVMRYDGVSLIGDRCKPFIGKLPDGITK